jgi:hypothetical protein
MGISTPFLTSRPIFAAGFTKEVYFLSNIAVEYSILSPPNAIIVQLLVKNKLFLAKFSCFTFLNCNLHWRLFSACDMINAKQVRIQFTAASAASGGTLRRNPCSLTGNIFYGNFAVKLLTSIWEM